MRLRSIFAALLILSFAFAAASAQENYEPERKPPAETRLFDEFGPIGGCDLGARIQNVFVELGQNPGTRGFVIVYRGADALPAGQTEKLAQRQIKRIQNEIKFECPPSLRSLNPRGMRFTSLGDCFRAGHPMRT